MDAMPELGFLRWPDQSRSKSLDWPTRIKIIDGIARGLLYLHQDSRLRAQDYPSRSQSKQCSAR
uniref:Protein kinase domain-containing protein n=1 Tax=Salix viminalis TaxID=40686 RepID=A0A6N2NFQ4_SALVM